MWNPSLDGCGVDLVPGFLQGLMRAWGPASSTLHRHAEKNSLIGWRNGEHGGRYRTVNGGRCSEQVRAGQSGGMTQCPRDHVMCVDQLLWWWWTIGLRMRGWGELYGLTSARRRRIPLCVMAAHHAASPSSFGEDNPASSLQINSCRISSASICKTLWNTVTDKTVKFRTDLVHCKRAGEKVMCAVCNTVLKWTTHSSTYSYPSRLTLSEYRSNSSWRSPSLVLGEKASSSPFSCLNPM